MLNLAGYPVLFSTSSLQKYMGSHRATFLFSWFFSLGLVFVLLPSLFTWNKLYKVYYSCSIWLLLQSALCDLANSHIQLRQMISRSSSEESIFYSEFNFQGREELGVLPSFTPFSLLPWLFRSIFLFHRCSLHSSSLMLSVLLEILNAHLNNPSLFLAFSVSRLLTSFSNHFE